MAVTTTNCMLLVLLMMFVTLVDINSNLLVWITYMLLFRRTWRTSKMPLYICSSRDYLVLALPYVVPGKLYPATFTLIFHFDRCTKSRLLHQESNRTFDRIWNVWAFTCQPLRRSAGNWRLRVEDLSVLFRIKFHRDRYTNKRCIRT